MSTKADEVIREAETDEDPDLESLNGEPPPDMMFGHMLDAVMSKHFEYSQDTNTLSLAEILLLLKQSIDTQNSIMSDLLKLKREKYLKSGR